MKNQAALEADLALAKATLNYKRTERNLLAHPTPRGLERLDEAGKALAKAKRAVKKAAQAA
jgi:hypothetical protein